MADGALTLDQVLGRRLRAARILSGKSVPELATQLSERWSKDKIYRAETGQYPPDVIALAEFADATGQSMGFFLEGITSAGAEEGGVLPHPEGVSQGRSAA